MTKTEILAEGLERVSQAAQRLGINRNTLYEWIKEGKIPFTCINGTYRVPRRAVSEMLENGLNMGDTSEQ